MSTAQKQEKYVEATSEIIQPIVESVRLIHPIKVWEDISPQFLVTFWSLSMYDLDVPNKSYDREIQKLKKQSQLSIEQVSRIQPQFPILSNFYRDFCFTE